MNSQWVPPLGFYLNLFPVTFAELPLKVMAVPAPEGVTLADLNAEHAPKRFYKARNTIYGYGPNQDELVSVGFHEETFNPEEWAEEKPALTSHLILEGFIECMVKDHGFYEEKVPRGERYEHALHDVKMALPLPVPDVKLYRGLVVRSIFVGTYAGSLSYGLVIDANFKTEIDHIISAAEVSTYRGYYVRLRCPRPLCSLNCELERFRGKLLGKLNTTSNTGYIPPCMADQPLSDFVALENTRVDCSVPLTLCQLDASPGSIQAYVTKDYGQDRANQIIRDIRVRSGDFTPHYKANVQASRDRLNLIVEMVSGTGGKYQLPTGQWVELSTRPILLKREGPVVS